MNKIDKSIFILGLGVTGISLARKLNFKLIYSWDDDPERRKMAKKKKLNLCEPNLENIKKIDLLFVSPGINHELKKPHIAIKLAKGLNIPIISDLEIINLLALKNFIIGITGTNGKSSTTSFIVNSLRYKNFIDAKACGNIGIPFTDLKINKDSVLVYECSSYQLAKVEKLRFNIAVLLNLSPDHIEWHLNLKNYIRSKKNIFKNQISSDHAIVSVDDKICRKIVKDFKSQYRSNLIKISVKRNIEDGIFLKEKSNSLLIINNICSEEVEIEKKKIKISLTKANLQNLLCNYVVNNILKQNKKLFIESIIKIKPLEHRVEFVGNYKNICFYNDSKSTNVHSSFSTLESYKNIFWILGGRKKSGGLSGVENKLDNILYSFTFGESGEEFKNFLILCGIKSFYKKTLKEITYKAVELALGSSEKINIIFSPCASSFDQFKNFEDRGKIFKKIIKNRVNLEK